MSSPAHRRPGLTGWQVHLSQMPVAIRSAEPTWPDRGRLFSFTTSQGALRTGSTLFAPCGKRLTTEPGSPGTGSRSGLHPAVTGDVFAEGNGQRRRRRSRLARQRGSGRGCRRRGHRGRADDDGRSVSDIARRAGLTGEVAASICEAWTHSEPTFAVSIPQAPTARPELASPLEIDAAFSSDAHHEIAGRVHAAGVAAGVYSGDDATALDRDVLAPAALGLLDGAACAPRRQGTDFGRDGRGRPRRRRAGSGRPQHRAVVAHDGTGMGSCGTDGGGPVGASPSPPVYRGPGGTRPA